MLKESISFYQLILTKLFNLQMVFLALKAINQELHSGMARFILARSTLNVKKNRLKNKKVQEIKK